MINNTGAIKMGQSGALRSSVVREFNTVGSVSTEREDLHLTTTHRFSVDGQANAVNYDQQRKAPALDRAAFRLGMEPGAEYRVSARGEIDKGGSTVSATDAQAGRPDRTRLQVQVSKDGRVLDSMNYAPGMKVEASKYPQGSELSAIFVDGKDTGEIRDNSGRLSVRVEQHEVRSSTSQTIVEPAPQPVASSNNSAAPAASIPPPEAPPAQPAQSPLKVAPDGMQIDTIGGYRIGHDGRRTSISSLNGEGRRQDIYIDHKKGVIEETDGTLTTFDEAMKGATYNLPDGTQLQFRRDAEGKILGLDAMSGDSRMSIIDHQKGPPSVETAGDGRQRRIQNAQNLDALNVHLVGLGSRVAQEPGAAPKAAGLYATRGGQELGWISRDEKTGANTLKPPLAPISSDFAPRIGTPAFEVALQNQVDDQVGRTNAQLERMGWNREAIEQAARWARPHAARPSARDIPPEWFGGAGGHFDSLPSMLAAVAALYGQTGYRSSLLFGQSYWG